MSTGFFDPNEEEGEFRDVPDEVSGKSANEILQSKTPGPVVPRRPPATPPAFQQKAAPVEVPEEYEYDVTDELEDEDDDYTAVLSDARLRLQQGSLYEIIMNHELFQGMDFDPAAIKHVQRQIRKFAKEQMEIMLGMRKETAKIERLEIDFPFNAVEVEVLKLVAKTASKGRSENSDRYVPAVTRTTEEVPVVPRRQGLNPIVGKKTTHAVPVKIEQKSAVAPLKKSAVAPVTRQAKGAKESIVVDGVTITPDMINATFEPDYKPLEKPLHELTTDELLERNRETSTRRHKTVKNPQAMPMPTPEQEEFMHLSRATELATKNNAVSLIMAAMNQKK